MSQIEKECLKSIACAYIVWIYSDCMFFGPDYRQYMRIFASYYAAIRHGRT